MNDVACRKALGDDADLVWPLVVAFATSFTPERTAFDRSFAELIERGDCLVLIAEHSGEAVGYLLANVHGTLFANGPVAWIEEVMVVDRHRRRGLGAELVAAAEQWAAAQGAVYTSLATRRAGEFYAALGYEDSAGFFRKLVIRH